MFENGMLSQTAGIKIAKRRASPAQKSAIFIATSRWTVTS